MKQTVKSSAAPERQRPRVGMLITKRFVLLHIPRTGGTFLRGVCFAALPADWLVENKLSQHASYESLPAECRDLPAIAFVRNPWDWYVSWYHHMRRVMPEKGPDTQNNRPLWVGAFGSGTRSFRDVVISHCTGENFDSSNRPIDTAPVMRKLGIDHYSATFEIVAGRGIREGRVDVGNFETLRQDFLTFLRRREIEVSDQLLAALRERPPINVADRDRASYRDYYDDELRDLVGEKAREIVSRYGYKF